MWWIYAIGSAVFAALTALLAKMGLAGVNTNAAIAIRTSVVFVLALLIVVITKTPIRFSSINRSTMVLLIFSGLTTGISWILYFKALELGKVSNVAAVDKLSVAFVVLLSVIVLGESLSWRELTGVLLIIFGTLILITK